MSDQAKVENLDNLPLLLAGPVLRQVTPESIAVWMALKQPCQVELTVHGTTQNGAAIGDPLFAGSRITVALGERLHVVVVTARVNAGQALVPDRLYAYDLQFTPSDTHPPSDPHLQLPQTLQQALCSDRFPDVTISYFEHQKPTFVLPPDCLEDLRLVQGSCRKAHGDGFDALPMLDCFLETAAHQPRQRPQQLFLTGDQIYGDDVADPLLWVATQLGERLLGWEEQLPGDRSSSAVTYTPKALPAGHRAEIATDQAGFTAGLHHKFSKVNSHLLGLGEYYASYLLAWSPVCWPATIPGGHQITHLGTTSRREYRQAVRRWDQEAEDMRQLIHTLWKVRRALANIATYTIFDDHDVSDDWNLNQAWCLRVLGRPLGRRAVQNALTAYAVFQAWGNTPWQFDADSSGAKLLQAAQDWSASRGTDTVASEAIARYVGLPAIDPHTDLPSFIRDGEVLILNRHADALTWHYTVQGACHEVLVLDTRTWRGYPADEKPIAPPMLLCPRAFEQQLSQPLRASASPKSSQRRMTFVVAPTNLFGLQAIDWIQRWQLSRNKVYSTDVGDAWNIHTEALAEFLTVLFKEREQIIVLSGDIHYSSLVRLSYRPTSAPEQPSVLVQLTCSALKNEEPLTKIIHTRLKDWLLPEKVRVWSGWFEPPSMVEHSAARHKQDSIPDPDWLCALEWMPRCRTQPPVFGNALNWLLLPGKRQKPRRHWFESLFFWRSHWFQDGREVVGLNNLALVQFESSRSLNAGQADKVIQDLYWFSSWSPTQIVYSRFESPLVPNQTLLKQCDRRVGSQKASPRII
ncbi:MAG: PhoD-like phosphatase [Oscillatoriophycideae cyanobacterium NC_groundwater_1537_Pr4_S-0.65um_50_18]|nr:PhoD-like phosphatase [Oscillatoriophycideae cyanobacterium NC_groundwater_1537_Pr4_S-0.65um_50_18]